MKILVFYFIALLFLIFVSVRMWKHWLTFTQSLQWSEAVTSSSNMCRHAQPRLHEYTFCVCVVLLSNRLIPLTGRKVGTGRLCNQPQMKRFCCSSRRCQRAAEVEFISSVASAALLRHRNKLGWRCYTDWASTSLFMKVCAKVIGDWEYFYFNVETF